MTKSLLDELEEIDHALTEGGATPEQEKRGQEIVRLADAAPDLVEALKDLLTDVEQLSGEFPICAEMAQSSFARTARTAIAKATGGELTPQEVKRITVHLEGGMVQDVSGIPRGHELHVEDHDIHDEEHPQWDAEKECIVTICQGAAT